MSTHPIAARRPGLSRRALAAAVAVLAIAVLLLLAHARYGHPALAWHFVGHPWGTHAIGSHVTAQGNRWA